MKIKNKLTLVFTLIVALLLIGLNFYIYIVSSTFARNNFYDELKNRALITATIFLERDEESASIIHGFEKNFLRTLPQEIIRVYNDHDQPVFIDSTDKTTFDTNIIDKIRDNKEFHYEKNGRQIEGIFYDDNQGQFIFIASAVDETGNAKLKQLQTVLIIGFLLSIIMLFFAGRFFTTLILKPVSDISDYAKKITETNLHLRLNEGNGKDELAELSITINHMLQRLEKAFDLQNNFVSNASHELRTPLTSIIGNIDVTLSKTRTEEDYRKTLESIQEEAEKLKKLTDGLLKLAQSNVDFINLHKEEIRLDEILFEVKDEIQTKRPGSKIEIIFSAMPGNAEELIIYGDKNLLEAAIANIVDNACKFSNSEKVTVLLTANPDKIIISIHDSGIGIPENEIAHVKETFYRAGNARSYIGSGIGLALADKIIHLHKGLISIISGINKGTDVTITFNRNVK